MRRWKGNTDWNTNEVSITPGANNPKICIGWNTYCVQHWRKPATMTANEDIVIPAHSQIIVPVNKIDEEDLNGTASRRDLITPLRSAPVLRNRFVVAYAYGEYVDKVIAKNMTHSFQSHHVPLHGTRPPVFPFVSSAALLYQIWEKAQVLIMDVMGAAVRTEPISVMAPVERDAMMPWR